MYRVLTYRGTFETKSEACAFAAELARQEKVYRVEVHPSAKALTYGLLAEGEQVPEVVSAAAVRN